MKENAFERKGLKKTVLTAAAVIGAATLLFQGFTQAAAAAEFKKTETVATSYKYYRSDVSGSTQNSLPDTAESSGIARNSIPEGYVKADYSIGNIDLEYFRNTKPTANDMTKEEAAEIGAQELWRVYGLNLEGQQIKMGYQQANENIPRSGWQGDVWIDGKLSYSFSVDSVTGELFNIGHVRTLKEKVSVGFDKELDKNPQEFAALAEKLAEKYNIVHGPVKSAEYTGQGYSNNDPDISFEIKGENGEAALMSLSRYDKELLGVIYDAHYKFDLANEEKYQKEFEEKIKEREKTSTPADDNGIPTLKAWD